MRCPEMAAYIVLVVAPLSPPAFLVLAATLLLFIPCHAYSGVVSYSGYDYSRFFKLGKSYWSKLNSNSNRSCHRIVRRHAVSVGVWNAYQPINVVSLAGADNDSWIVFKDRIVIRLSAVWSYIADPNRYMPQEHRHLSIAVDMPLDQNVLEVVGGYHGPFYLHDWQTRQPEISGHNISTGLGSIRATNGAVGQSQSKNDQCPVSNRDPFEHSIRSPAHTTVSPGATASRQRSRSVQFIVRMVGNGRFACLRILSSSKWRSDQIHSRAPSAGIDSSAPVHGLPGHQGEMP